MFAAVLGVPSAEQKQTTIEINCFPSFAPLNASNASSLYFPSAARRNLDADGKLHFDVYGKFNLGEGDNLSLTQAVVLADPFNLDVDEQSIVTLAVVEHAIDKSGSQLPGLTHIPT